MKPGVLYLHDFSLFVRSSCLVDVGAIPACPAGTVEKLYRKMVVVPEWLRLKLYVVLDLLEDAELK
ncbi:hypothetical protein CULC22_00059 [Corynebacterium ulcerans BR-AD22]|nr:hypothetical protein CULC22_00059 [Corynebacterium ulcerans BR-AD22]